MKLWKYPAIAIALAAVSLTALNASWLAGQVNAPLVLVARNGFAQPVADGASGPCAAVQMALPGPLIIENSLHGMHEATRLGARGFALDVRRTADGQLVVFRDPTLDCRTNGRGPVSARTLAELRRLDFGFGYTPDGGRSFPLRGRGMGGIATVPDILQSVRSGRLIFILRDPDPALAEPMAQALRRAGTEVQERVGLIGPEPVIARLRALLPGIWTFSREASEACLAAYRSSGWTGFVPEECRDTVVALTTDTDWRLWGFPYRFYQRMAGAGTEVMTVGGFDSDGVPTGLTQAEQLGDVPRHFRGLLWVEDMQNVGRALVY
jgi:glycerophosphoryl diester phosphodiesterase